MKSRISAALVAIGLCAAPAVAQSLEGQYRVIGSAVRAAFEPLREVLQDCSAVLYDGRTPFAFGAVASPDGYILTKASELEGREGFTVRIDEEHYTEVTVVATSFEWDVALLKVDAAGLTPVQWVDSVDLPRGSWVISNGATSRTRRRVRPGIISASTREIGGETQVVIGVALQVEEETGRILVGAVAEGGGAEEAGLEEGDVFLEAEGRKLESREDLLELLGTKEPGDVLPVRVRRGEEELEFEIKLTARNKVFEERMTRNDQMSGPVSERRTNFPRALQHDAMLSPRSMGGPLLDLDGRAVGLNIAYANRSEVFAIPAEDARRLFEELKAEGGRPQAAEPETSEAEAEAAE